VLCAPAALLVCLLLAACGSSSPGSSTSQSAAATEAQGEAKIAAFARCLRDHGLQAETASGPGGAHGLKIRPGNGGSGAAALETAQKACARYRPVPKTIDLSPQQKVQREEQVQKFARCMREHGIKVEASTSGGGVQVRLHAHAGEAGAPNPESPGFQAAQSSCQKLLPFKGPGPDAGPPSTSHEGSVPSGKQAGGLSLAGGG
jgi:hypothetical protein